MTEKEYLNLPKDKKGYGVVYLAKNSLNNKIYIGQTRYFLKRKNAHRRLGESLKTESINSFYTDIVEHGFNIFVWDIIAICNNDFELCEKEKEYIALYKEKNPNEVYNISDGGIGGNTYRNRSYEDNLKTRKKLSDTFYKKTEEELKVWKETNSKCHKKYYAEVDPEKEKARKRKIKETKNSKSEEELERIKQKLSIALGVKVVCVELNLSFNSLGEACAFIKQQYNISYDNRNIKESIKESKAIKGFSWRYL